jgi:hypothetical protein
MRGAPRARAPTLVRIGGTLMRVNTLSIAVALALVPLPAVAFDQDEFCTTVTDIARPMNVRVDGKLANSEPGMLPTATMKLGARPSTTAGASSPR